MAGILPQMNFGVGQLIAQPVGGGSPVPFGALEDVSVDFSADLKELNGAYTYALGVAKGKSKVSIKATYAELDINAFNAYFFGGTVSSTNVLQTALGEAHSVPAVSTYTVTVTNSATFLQDQGVFYAATGKYMTQVASGPVQGQYSVASGVYTFAAADASAAVVISYTYTVASTGHDIIVTNQLMGSAPTFQILLSDTYNGPQGVQTVNFIGYAAVSSKLTATLKADDYTKFELDFMLMANAAGQVCRITSSS